ncbi:MAG: glycosyltransferase family A protein [Planctomycetota bacterium]
MLQTRNENQEKRKTVSQPKYVLITPTRNEEEHIGRAIQAIAAQTVRPVRWVIVSDGSTDRTDEIVRTHAAEHPFIELVLVGKRKGRDFASKVRAFNLGYDRLKKVDYDFIGNLDADISVGPDYYESILAEFAGDEKLGLAGGVRYDLYQGEFVRFTKANNSVGGCVQLYRKACFEDTGGFIPVEYGGEDAIAEIMARMHGWKVKSFPNEKIYHYRETGAMNKGALKTRFREGIKDYLIGYHPLFELLRCIYRARQKRPFILGGVWSMLGYLRAWIGRLKRPVPDEMVKYLRKEQMRRIRNLSP